MDGDRATASVRMPVLFIGHGSPMNAVEDNPWSRGFTALASLIPRPRAIVAVSAHWFDAGTLVTGTARPETIHDFSGFPAALYDIRYPAPGSPELAGYIVEVLGEDRVSPSGDWGLDHGTWSVLRWMYPRADIPVVQLSIDSRLSVRQHYDLGRRLGRLRDTGVLVLGSGNIVHNLGDAFQRRLTDSTGTPEWAVEFDRAVAEALVSRDTETLLTLWPDSETGCRAHPTPDHWLPLVYAYSTTTPDDAATFPVEGFDWGSISMRAVLFGVGG